MTKFESHITLNKPKDITEAKLLFKIASDNNIKTSWITGDPVLGVGKWFYISGYSTDFDNLLEKVKNVSHQIKNNNIEVIREKIEQIMYDTKTNYFTCGVDCFACLDN